MVDDGPRRDRLLLPALHVLQRRALLAEDRDPARPDPIRLLELPLQRAPRQLELRRQPGPARLVRDLEAGGPVRLAHVGDEQVDDRHGDGLLPGREQDPLDPRRPADARGRRAAELLDEAVVAAAAADTGLRAERVARELEDRARVVVEPAHERRVDLVRQVGAVEQRAHGGEVLGVLTGETVEQPRRPGHHVPCPGVVGIERAQRVLVDARADLIGEAVLVRAQVRLQLLAIGGARLRGAERAESQPHVSDAERLQQLGEQQDRLRVDGRVRGSDRLGPDLPELALTPRLRALVAEERRQVPELHRLRQLLHAVLEVGAADRRGPLRAQRQRAAAAVLERVHLLLDDVGRGADPPREQLGRLERGRLDLPIAGRAEDPARGLLDRGAAGRLVGQHVVGPSRGLRLGAHERAGGYRASACRKGFDARSAPSVVIPM